MWRFSPNLNPVPDSLIECTFSLNRKQVSLWMWIQNQLIKYPVTGQNNSLTSWRCLSRTSDCRLWWSAAWPSTCSSFWSSVILMALKWLLYLTRHLIRIVSISKYVQPVCLHQYQFHFNSHLPGDLGLSSPLSDFSPLLQQNLWDKWHRFSWRLPFLSHPTNSVKTMKANTNN